MNEAGLDGAEPPREIVEDEPSSEERQSLAEYLLGEEGGEWLWLLATLVTG